MEEEKAAGNGKGQSKPSALKTEVEVAERKERASEPTTRGAGGRPPREELTPAQLRGMKALLTQPTMVAAAEEIGVHPRTISRWTKEPAFRAEYLGQMTELQMELWRQMLAVTLDAVAAGHFVVPIDHVYRFDQIVEAHTAMEAGGAAGKLVVTT